MPTVFPDSFDTVAGVLAATQDTLLKTTRELAAVRNQLSAEVASSEALRMALSLRDGALNASSSHFMIVDLLQPKLPIIYVNRVLASEHGYEPAQLIGHSVRILGEKDLDRERAQQILAEILAGRSVRAESIARRSDGTTFQVGFCSTPLRNAHGVITHFVSVGADITARKEAERKKQELQEQLYNEMRERERMAIELRLAQKLESVGRLAAGLAHEINTPIQYVGDSVYFLRTAFEDFRRLFDAYREVIAQLPVNTALEPKLAQLGVIEREIDYEFLSSEVPKAFQRTMEGADRVTGIVRAMKEFAHPDANEHSPADLNHALQTTLTVSHSEYKYIASTALQLAELPAVTCNIGELNQVFLNLIINAAHAIHDSGKDATTGRIEVQTRADGDFVEIAIADNGCGIAQQNLEKIFDPFFTTKEVGRGTGQGLAIARSIVVDKHGGNINVRSEVGVGTQFVLRLPIAGRSTAACD